MDKQPLKIAAIAGVIVLALAGIAYGMKSASAAEDYKPSPGGQSGSAGKGASSGPPPGAVPPMPGGPPAGRIPGSAR